MRKIDLVQFSLEFRGVTHWELIH